MILSPSLSWMIHFFSSARIYTKDRDTPRTLNLRFKVITQWKVVGVDFMTNCVFMDEAWFNSYQIRRRTWSLKGKPTNVKVPNQKDINISIIGCIATFGTIQFFKSWAFEAKRCRSVGQGISSTCYKKRKAKMGQEEAKPKVKKGATAYHVVRYVNNVMDFLDRHDKKRYYIVMDNCRIRHSALALVVGYKPLFTPHIHLF